MKSKNSDVLGRADLLDEALDRPFDDIMACATSRCGISEVPPRLGLRKESRDRFESA